MRDPMTGIENKIKVLWLLLLFCDAAFSNMRIGKAGVA
jgi:hypothetical protein